MVQVQVLHSAAENEASGLKVLVGDGELAGCGLGRDGDVLRVGAGGSQSECGGREWV